MTPKQRAEARILLMQNLIAAFKAGMDAALERPDDAQGLLSRNVDEVNAMLIRSLLPSVNALLDELEMLGVTP